MTFNGAGHISITVEQLFALTANEHTPRDEDKPPRGKANDAPTPVEPPLSPTTEAKINRMRQAVQSGEAQLKNDSQGRPLIVYANERAIQVEKDADDIGLPVDGFLEMTDGIKRSTAPTVVVTDPTKVGISDLDQYEEGQQFTCTKEVLGEGSSGDVVVVRDKETGTEHALKMVKISDFCSHEVRSLVDLGDSDHFPRLYLFQLVSKVALHMEKVEHGVTLTDIIYRHMPNLRLNAPELIRPFALCMFHYVLSAVREMNDKGWTHRDLHSGNVMITKDAMKLKILDLGEAQPLQKGSSFNHDDWKKDILDAIRLFCGVYITQDFVDNCSLENKIKAGVLKKVLERAPLSEKDRVELLELIEMTYELTENPKLEGYRSTYAAMKRIEDILPADKMSDVKKQAAEILFPDFYRADGDIDLGKEGEVEVTTDDSVPGDTATEIPDKSLQELSLHPREDV